MKQFIAGSDKHLRYLAGLILSPDGSLDGWGLEYFDAMEDVYGALRNFVEYGSLQECDVSKLRRWEKLFSGWIVERVQAEGEDLLDLLED